MPMRRLALEKAWQGACGRVVPATVRLRDLRRDARQRVRRAVTGPFTMAGVMGWVAPEAVHWAPPDGFQPQQSFLPRSDIGAKPRRHRHRLRRSFFTASRKAPNWSGDLRRYTRFEAAASAISCRYLGV